MPSIVGANLHLTEPTLLGRLLWELHLFELLLFETHRPGVVLMDISMPILNGFDATSIITTDFPDTKVIVLTMNTNKIFSDRACNAGACNFLAKDCDKEKLLSAIKHCSLR
jgi:DNA-binding NarL/FixJ family response regulator